MFEKNQPGTVMVERTHDCTTPVMLEKTESSLVKRSWFRSDREVTHFYYVKYRAFWTCPECGSEWKWWLSALYDNPSAFALDTDEFWSCVNRKKFLEPLDNTSSSDYTKT